MNESKQLRGEGTSIAALAMTSGGMHEAAQPSEHPAICALPRSSTIFTSIMFSNLSYEAYDGKILCAHELFDRLKIARNYGNDNQDPKFNGKAAHDIRGISGSLCRPGRRHHQRIHPYGNTPGYGYIPLRSIARIQPKRRKAASPSHLLCSLPSCRW